MRKQTRWALVGAALASITASCQEPPATERDDSAPTPPAVTAEVTSEVPAEVAAEVPPEVTTTANLPLKDIMQGLEGDLATLAHGLWVEDRKVVGQAAGRIADHPRVIPTQMVAIQTALGSSFPSFVAHDQDVHQAALALAEAADSMMSVPELFDGYLRIQRGCLSCHMAFRARVSEAVTDEGGVDYLQAHEIRKQSTSGDEGSLGTSTFAPDTLISYVRIYADAEGESHFEDVEVDLDLIEVAPGISPLFASSFSQASRYAFLSAKPGWREDWHPAPQRQFLVYLAGVTEFKVSDGEIRRLGPGTILLAEDTIGRGHISEVVGEADVIAVLIQLERGG